MPDLSHEATHRFWHAYRDASIYRVLAHMEAVEDWTLDGAESLEQAIKQLADTLDEVGNYDLEANDDFIEIAGQIKMSRLLRLMQVLDAAHPGSASRLLIAAEQKTRSNDDPAGLFMRRNIVFERLRLLYRVFAPERFALITRALEREEE